MRLSHFFIDHPVFAFVISILITLMGALAFPGLPVAQYPQIAPPTISVSAQFPGANAETLSSLVAVPLEESINGVENMLYMSASSTGDGRVNVTVTFKLGTDLNAAQVLVQNRVQTVLPQLPTEVQRFGLTVRKASADLLMVVNLYSPDGSLDQQYVSNYVTLHLLSPLLRVPGVGDIQVRGARDYAMRIWIDPDKAAARGLTADDIVTALRNHNVDVAAGSVGGPPFGPNVPDFQLQVQAQGRLETPEAFSNVVVRRGTDGTITKVSDVARVELGSADYSANSYLSKRTAVGIPIQAQPNANALETANAVQAQMKTLSRDFPAGMAYAIVYNPTDFVQASVDEVRKALLEALILVVLVVLVFLQSWRTALVPIVAIPVSLIGTFAVMKVAGFSINNLSLFGLVLAIGIVVDDAIVVVESVERNMRLGLDPREAAHRTMDEVGGALIAIALVLTAVFVPTAFIPGISGQFYQQFALTIASATLISLIVSQTLSPSLAALIMQPHKHIEGGRPSWRRHPIAAFSDRFNRGFDRLSEGYSGLVRRVVRLAVLMVVVYVGLIALTGWRVSATPTGFIPAQDQGSVICVVSLPPGSSLARTDAVVRRVVAGALATNGVAASFAVAGVDFSIQSNNPASGSAFIVLKSFEERRKQGWDTPGILKALRRSVADEQGATVRFLQPPPVRGIGSAGGFKMIIEDQSGKGSVALEAAVNKLAEAARASKAVTSVFTNFNTKTPQLLADVDREKADTLGVPVNAVLTTLQTYLGSSFINNFSYLGRTFRVTAQAEGASRATEQDIGRLQTRAANGAMTPLSAVTDVKRRSGAYRTVTYNVYPSAEIQGDTPAGYSSGQTLAAMATLAKQTLPEGFSYEWTELAYQQQLAGDTGTLVFGLAVVFVFLLLAALYESVTMPLSVILIVPMCLLAAFVGVNLRGQDNNILTQVGLVVLVGLAAKNAILIVEFARQGELEHGLDRFAAAESAARVRLRPILMTSFAFILGVVPLAFASGAGAEMRIALGTAVFFGMIGVTFFGLVFTPVFYVITRRLSALLPQPPRPHSVMPTTGEPPRDAGEETVG